MGDMKTPDFDDLLAAFDIPDIDAKEAIQSESADPDANHSESGGSGTKERSGGSNQRPVGPSEIRETSHDQSVVSVIVKNSICADAYENRRDEEENASRQVSDVLDEAERCRTGGQLSPQVAHSLMPMDPLLHSGFKAVSGGVVENALLSSQSQMQPKGHLWSPCSPKIAREGDESNQGDGPSNPSPNFSPHMPLPASASSISCTNYVSLPLAKADEEEVECPAAAFASQTRPINNSSRAEVNQALSEDEESEPDLGSPPLMIQESPDVQMSSPLRFPGRHRSSAELQPPPPSSPSLPISNTQTGETTSVSPHPPPLVSQQTPPQSNNIPEKTHPPIPELYPEHIIEERDSPESPEPEMPACPQWKSLSSTPEQELGEKEPVQDKTSEVSDKEEPIENARNEQEHSKCDSDKVENENTAEPEEEEPSVLVSVASVEKRSGSSVIPSRPLKVRIKTVKTPTGNITRTVTRVAAKGAAAGISKGPDGSKIPIGGRKAITRPKRPAAAMSGQAPDSKTTMLPVSTLQDASSAMLFAASKAQKVASNVTKTSTTPSVSSSSSSSSAISICSIGQKTVAVPSTKPATIVNSPGAVISRSQSSLVEAFNKILNSKNPLPSYQPDLSILPRPEWGLGVPASGYRCLECGDAFALERSLARHYDRRSLRIEVTCNLCTKRLAFFNKCSLLLHAREHKEKGLVMQCSHLVMRPVSVEQMIGQQDTVPIGMLTPPSLLASSSLTGSCDNWCPECKNSFGSKEKLAAHFQESDPGGIDTCCMQCSPPMPLWNACSAAAHQRLHKKLHPLVCPECGTVCQSHGLNTHVRRACLHYTRQLGYRCPCCQLVFGGVNSLNAVKNHMHTAHSEVFHKCPSCPMAFKSASSADTHSSTQHPQLSEKAKQSKEIYKCVMCRTVFTQKALLNVHFDTHLVTQKVNVFKCPDCHKLFTQRTSLLEHVKASHRKSAAHLTPKGSVKMESSDGEEWRKEEDEDGAGYPGGKESSASPNLQSWSCSECQTSYTDKESYITHMAKQHKKELKRFPCTLCEGSFSSSSSLRRHFRVKHKGIKRSLYCQLCTGSKKSFSSKLVLEKHMQIHHGGQRAANSQRQVSSRFTDPADSSSEQDGALTTATPEENNNTDHFSFVRNRRGGSAQEQDTEGFRCMPCGFVSEDKEEFLHHIQSHRGEGGKGVQCQQCGACFTSASSLARHRFISHRVRDGDEQRENTNHDAAEGAESPGSPTPAEEGDGRLSCKVCRRHFSKAADLNTHFRSHGMAFINAYKAEKPA
ncbi:zinc finger protein 687a isoform X1 [Ictalurus furcatus]|uniref:zinc finger protein 687a isoform X1 n=2 Tax=Ictalurus furcatus TaxID=66913 RepID=UPI0023506AB3|nr:zinc finger protein 687a isoform X1 [Ictalurus furcatus]XP_053480412.1 zinc finger protein 687a isoform X1 [Ictalurus furcatus]